METSIVGGAMHPTASGGASFKQNFSNVISNDMVLVFVSSYTANLDDFASKRPVLLLSVDRDIAYVETLG